MSAQPTPGPWVASDDWVETATGGFVAQAFDGNRKGHTDQDIAAANARLIAAAPDLLKALNELLEQIDCLGGVEYSRDVEPYKAEACWDDAIRRAQDAISKATSSSSAAGAAPTQSQDADMESNENEAIGCGSLK